MSTHKVATALQVSGAFLIGLGIARLVVAAARDEGPDASGLVLGVVIGIALCALGWYTITAAEWVKVGKPWLAAIPAAFALIAATSTAILLAGIGGVDEGARGTRRFFGGLAFFGFFLVMATGVLLPMLLALSHGAGWLADRIPALRRRGVGDVIRRYGQNEDQR